MQKFINFVTLIILSAASCNGAIAAETEVELFGQPCRLVGPVEPNVLKAVHAVSPGQAYPDSVYDLPTPASVKLLQDSYTRVKSASPLPPELDPYREKLLRRILALTAFHDGYLLASKSGKPGALLEKTGAFTSQHAPKAFESNVRKLWSASAGDEDRAERLMSDYLDRIGADPEDEFHRVSRKLQIRYTCAFEEKGESAE